VQMTLVLIMGPLVFDVPIVGSLLLLYGVAFIFIAGNRALGLFFSPLASPQQQATRMSFLALLPNIPPDGFMFPFEAMPAPARILGQGLPLTHFLRAVRGIALKGAGLPEVWPQLVWLSAILLILVSLTSLRFSKKLG